MDPLILGQVLSVTMFVVVVALLMLGYPVAFTLGGIGVLFAFVGGLAGAFDMNLFGSIPQRFFGTTTNVVLIAVPLFVFMGVVLERSKIAETLLTTMGQLFGGLRGGLGISVVIVGTLLAASTGIVGATVVTMGLLSLPAMMRAGYDPKLATGTICAAGTLGQIIPPSTVLIFIADILQGANAQAQMARGNFSADTVSVGDLFAGAFIPGLMLSLLYIAWIVFMAIWKPQSCPALPMTAEEKRGLGHRIVVALVPPLILIFAVLGSILAGVATPTESAAVGALGAILLTVVKMLSDRWAQRSAAEEVERRLFWFWIGALAGFALLSYFFGAFGLLTALIVVLAAALVPILADGTLRETFVRMMGEVGRGTLSITAMVFVILLGASIFALVFTNMGGGQLVTDFLNAMPGGAFGAMFVVMLIMFILGFFLDTFEIIFIVVPIAGPVLLMMGLDPIWLGVMMGVVLQTSFLTPPFGFSLFYLKGVAPKGITTGHIYRGVTAFVAIQVVVLGMVWASPGLATYLPNMIFRSAPPPVVEQGSDPNVPEVEGDHGG